MLHCSPFLRIFPRSARLPTPDLDRLVLPPLGQAGNSNRKSCLRVGTLAPRLPADHNETVARVPSCSLKSFQTCFGRLPCSPQRPQGCTQSVSHMFLMCVGGFLGLCSRTKACVRAHLLLQGENNKDRHIEENALTLDGKEHTYSTLKGAICTPP